MMNNKIKEIKENSSKSNSYMIELISAEETIKGQNILDKVPDNVHVVGEEMESFALLHIAKKYHVEASALITCVDSEFVNYILTPEERQNCLDDMLRLALESIIK